MGWLSGERRGPGCKDQTLASTSPPPLPLLGIFLIVFLLLSLLDYRVQMQKMVSSLRLFPLVLPIVLLLLARDISINGRLVIRLPKPEQYSIHRAGTSPWGVAALVLLLLFLVSFQPTLQSKLFRPL